MKCGVSDHLSNAKSIWLPFLMISWEKEVGKEVKWRMVWVNFMNWLNLNWIWNQEKYRYTELYMLCYAKANVISTNLRYQLYNLQLKSTFYIVNLATLSLFKVLI